MADKLGVVIVEENGEWDVWIGLPDTDPRTDAFGFIAGIGDTRDAAVADAVASLEDTIDYLQSPPGVVDERSEDR